MGWQGCDLSNPAGLLSPYFKNNDIKVCPTGKSIPFPIQGTWPSYGYNELIWNANMDRHFPSLSVFQQPSETVIFGDAATYWDGYGISKDMALYPASETSLFDAPSAHGLHGGSMCNVAWIDGHAKSLHPVPRPNCADPAQFAANNLGDLLKGARTGNLVTDSYYFLADKTTLTMP